MFGDGRAPWQDGFDTDDSVVKNVYDSFTEFNKNYTPKQFYPAY